LEVEGLTLAAADKTALGHLDVVDVEAVLGDERELVEEDFASGGAEDEGEVGPRELGGLDDEGEAVGGRAEHDLAAEGGQVAAVEEHGAAGHRGLVIVDLQVELDAFGKIQEVHD